MSLYRCSRYTSLRRVERSGPVYPTWSSILKKDLRRISSKSLTFPTKSFSSRSRIDHICSTVRFRVRSPGTRLINSSRTDSMDRIITRSVSIRVWSTSNEIAVMFKLAVMAVGYVWAVQARYEAVPLVPGGLIMRPSATSQRVLHLQTHPETAATCLKYFASLNAVSAVIPRFLRTISFIRLVGAPMSRASRFWLRFIGLRNSSRRISPGCTGSSFSISKICTPNVGLRFPQLTPRNHHSMVAPHPYSVNIPDLH